MSETIKFNTLRGYTPEGQIIEASVIGTEPCPIFEDETVLRVKFTDHSRNISGTMTVSELSERAIMQSYDNGWYE